MLGFYINRAGKSLQGVLVVQWLVLVYEGPLGGYTPLTLVRQGGGQLRGVYTRTNHSIRQLADSWQA